MTGAVVDAAANRITALRAAHTHPDRVVVLVAGSISNGAQIAHVHGGDALDIVNDEVVARLVDVPDVVTVVIGTSRVGGFLVACVVERELAHTQVELVATAARGLIDIGADLVWPVVTIGVRACDGATDPREALRDVMATVLSGSRTAPGCTRWFDTTDTAGPHEDLMIVRDLSIALSSDPRQLGLAFQPVVGLRDGGLLGAEALLRWKHPYRGWVSPLVTVEAAERTGLIVPLGQHVLFSALAQAAAWRDDVDPGFRMHVNVSPLELRDPAYVDRVERALDHWELDPAGLLLEITETALLADNGVIDTLYGLRDLGVGTGIDDFGTGYASLAHLRSLPIDTVKIDRSLVAGVGDGGSDASLTQAVFRLVSSLDVTVVAEGIETAAQAAHLRAMGCSVGQGYHLGRPVPADEMLAPVRPRLVEAVGA